MSLPSGYKRVEYIESTGTQYIDSGVVAPTGWSVECEVEFTSLSANNFLFGGHGSSSPFYRSYIGTSSSGNWLVGAYLDTSLGSVSANVRYALDVCNIQGSIKFLANGVEQGASESLSTTAERTTNSLHVFAVNYWSNMRSCKAKLYSLKVYLDAAKTNLVRDYVPAVNSSGTAGLYDLKNNRFYTNAGTGTFSVGRRVVESLDGWKELEYIESSGTQYIDTGFKPNNNTQVVCDMAVTTAGTSFLFGARHNSSANSTSYSFSFVQISGTSLRSDYGSVETAIAMASTQRLKIDKNKNTTTVNGTTVTATTQIFSTSYNLVLFSTNTAGTIFATKTAGKLYSCKIYDNGTLVRDYIPYRSPEGDVGLYDAANGIFYENAGTGVFVGGPRVVRSLEGWTPVEYIESTGTQYIDTGFVPNQDTRIVTDARFTDTSGTVSILGQRDNGITKSFAWISVTGNLRSYYRTEYTAVTSADTNRHIYDLNKNATVIDGTTVKTRTYGSFTGAFPVCLFACNDWGTVTWFAKLKLYSCQIYDNGTVVRDYLPYVDPDGAAGLYDSQNSTFYENSGSGVFVAGASLLPGVPTNLSTTTTQGKVSLTWDADANADGYRIYRDWELIASVTEPRYTDEVSKTGTYLYEVTAYNEFAESESASTSVKVTVEIPCPGCFQQTEQGVDSVCLAWDPVECDKYRLYRDGELLTETTATTYTDTGLESYQTYEYAVTSVVAETESVPVVVLARTAEVYTVQIVSVDSASFSANPTNINTKTVLTVTISEATKYLEPAKRYVGELYSGEV